MPQSSVIFKRATLVGAPKSLPKQADVLYSQGKIIAIGSALTATDADSDTVSIDAQGLCLSAGWLDLGATLCEPGHEYKDDAASLAKSAIFGGFAEIAVLPATDPVVQTQEGVAFVQLLGQRNRLPFHPIGALTKDLAGKSLAEIMDMRQAGAVAFANGHIAIEDASLFSNALQYLQGATMIERPIDSALAKGGQMHEGIAITMLGMKGIPSLAEDMAVAKALSLLAYSGGKLHLSCLSCAESLARVRQAKAAGLAVTCDVAAHQIAFTDQAMMDFDTYLKVNPPFRLQSDIDAIWAAMADGTIDAVISDHTPHDPESKQLEFDLASFGILGLETAFAVLHTHGQGKLSLERMVELLSSGPRAVLGLPEAILQEGATTSLTLFDPHEDWTFGTKHIQSKARNTPFVGAKFTGRALAVLNTYGLHTNKALDGRVSKS